jgi:hypothetical protein
MKNALTCELEAELAKLNPLITETHDFIGHIAWQAYAELHKMPGRAGGYRPLMLDSRYFHTWIITHDVELPAEPARSNDAYAVVKTSTETSVRRHYSQRSGRARTLPGEYAQNVRVNLEPSAGNTIRKFSIFGFGMADFNGNRTETYPSKEINTTWYPWDKRYHYMDVGELRGDYVEKYGGALAVTAVVIKGLEVAHGIMMDGSDARPLIEQWRAERAEPGPAASYFLRGCLPPDVAELVGPGIT